MTARVHIEPCPFCGSAAFGSRRIASDYVDVVPKAVDGALSVCMDGNGYYWVECSNCYAKGPHFGGESRSRVTRGPVRHTADSGRTAMATVAAIEAWNLRQPPQLVLEVDE